ncbi:hypothetical protein GOODEAATRI_033858 [Goodea atripinnis]|uniref:Uncharacterized protein n=1 Tax=Goodea atripinnis TaxID=208336 RepID=A0ABV0NQD7_9TELE
MEELSAVGEQVFDAECILNKRLRKVGPLKQRLTFRSAVFILRRLLTNVSLRCGCFSALVSGKVGVSGEVEGMVIQNRTRTFSQSKAPSRNQKNTSDLCFAFRNCLFIPS